MRFRGYWLPGREDQTKQERPGMHTPDRSLTKRFLALTLDPIVDTAPAVDTGDLRRVSRRRERHAARFALWQVTDQRRIAYCGRFPANEVGVVVKASGSVADGTRRAGLGGVQSCGSVWACPVCSEKIQAERQAEVSETLRRWREDHDGTVTFLTLTMRHNAGHSLAALWAALSHAWARTTSSAGDHWKADKHDFRIEHYLRVVEVTHGKNGWHVHVHCLLLHGNTLTDVELQLLEHRLYGRWEKALKSRGFQTSAEHGIDLRRVGDGDALGDYFTKTTYAGAAYEVTGSASKKAGKGRTPFQILGEIVSPNEHSDTDNDERLWREWEKASKGRRQLVWSRGLRDLIGLNAELSDEEIVEQDHGGDVLEYLHEEWYPSKLASRVVQLLEAAEADDTGEALAALLNRYRARRVAASYDGEPPGT